ncbi:MAG: hypothetical protein HXM44_11650, partial [Lautropia mirabilis]|nr:hypothetical protein [Lautropia mirabilis]
FSDQQRAWLIISIYLSVLGIEWPLDQVGGLSAVLVSDKDKIGKPLAEADVYAEGQP